ncbi:hypothetical protein C0J52_19966 [Blattella germanica]|nr:hypothetical protein C0J52_19966 [Blattella germanica]
MDTVQFAATGPPRHLKGEDLFIFKSAVLTPLGVHWGEVHLEMKTKCKLFCTRIIFQINGSPQ